MLEDEIGMSKLINAYLSVDRHPASKTLANFVDSVLSHLLNTMYAVRYAHPNAFGTSHTPRMSGDIGRKN